MSGILRWPLLAAPGRELVNPNYTHLHPEEQSPNAGSFVRSPPHPVGGEHDCFPDVDIALGGDFYELAFPSLHHLRR